MFEHNCYILFDDFNKTYVGYTVDLNRRIRQHNKEIKGGARFTSKRVQGEKHWKYLLTISSDSSIFNKNKALSMEWSIKNPTNRRTNCGYTPMKKIQALHHVFSNPKFKDINFTVSLYDHCLTEYIKKTLGNIKNVTFTQNTELCEKVYKDLIIRPIITKKTMAGKRIGKSTPANKKPVEKEVKNVEQEQEGEVQQKKASALGPIPMPFVKLVSKQLQEDGNSHVTKNLQDLKTVMETMVNTIVNQCLKGETVALPNHVTFKPVLRNERTHKNPKTKEEIVKPAHYVLSMDVKARLKDRFASLPVDEESLEKVKQQKKQKPAEA